MITGSRLEYVITGEGVNRFNIDRCLYEIHNSCDIVLSEKVTLCGSNDIDIALKIKEVLESISVPNDEFRYSSKIISKLCISDIENEQIKYDVEEFYNYCASYIIQKQCIGYNHTNYVETNFNSIISLYNTIINNYRNNLSKNIIDDIVAMYIAFDSIHKFTII